MSEETDWNGYQGYSASSAATVNRTDLDWLRAGLLDDPVQISPERLGEVHEEWRRFSGALSETSESAARLNVGEDGQMHGRSVEKLKEDSNKLSENLNRAAERYAAGERALATYKDAVVVARESTRDIVYRAAADGDTLPQDKTDGSGEKTDPTDAIMAYRREIENAVDVLLDAQAQFVHAMDDASAKEKDTCKDKFLAAFKWVLIALAIIGILLGIGAFALPIIGTILTIASLVVEIAAFAVTAAAFAYGEGNVLDLVLGALFVLVGGAGLVAAVRNGAKSGKGWLGYKSNQKSDSPSGSAENVETPAMTQTPEINNGPSGTGRSGSGRGDGAANGGARGGDGAANGGARGGDGAANGGARGGDEAANGGGVTKTDDTAKAKAEAEAKAKADAAAEAKAEAASKADEAAKAEETAKGAADKAAAAKADESRLAKDAADKARAAEEARQARAQKEGEAYDARRAAAADGLSPEDAADAAAKATRAEEAADAARADAQTKRVDADHARMAAETARLDAAEQTAHAKTAAQAAASARAEANTAAEAAAKAADEAESARKAATTWSRTLDKMGWTSSNRNFNGYGSTFVDKVLGINAWDRVFHFQKFENWYAAQKGKPGFQDTFPDEFPMDQYKAWSATEDVKVDSWAVTGGYGASQWINGALGTLQTFKSGWGMIGRSGLFYEWATGEPLNTWKDATAVDVDNGPPKIHTIEP